MSDNIQLKIEISVSPDGWYDVKSSVRTSPTSVLSGIKRCYLDEIDDFVSSNVRSFVEEELRTSD